VAREVVLRQAGEDGSERHRLVDEGLIVGQQQGGDRGVELGVAQCCAEDAQGLALAPDAVLQPGVPAGAVADAAGGPGLVREAVVVGRSCA